MNKISTNTIIKESRSGLKDIWNAFMAEGATFMKHDIPYCPTTAKKLPSRIITWDEAKAIYKKNSSNKAFHCDAFVCFYMDDYIFDGPRGIWNFPLRALEVIRHFAGAITPDFSTYQDFPEGIKAYSTYRMRIFGYWMGKNDVEVINNVRWGTPETWDYCFEGIPSNSIVAIGTVGGSPRKHSDKKRFEDGLFQMVKKLSPHTIIVYGSANYECFKKLQEQCITVISFKSNTAEYWEGRKHNE